MSISSTCFGICSNDPIATGNLNDSIMVLVDGKWINLYVPYHGGCYTKWVEGRIDDANVGWKGESLWTTTSTCTMFQLRPLPTNCVPQRNCSG